MDLEPGLVDSYRNRDGPRQYWAIPFEAAERGNEELGPDFKGIDGYDVAIREPNDLGMIELQPRDSRPDWLDEENAWRKELMQENDDWNDEIPSVHLGQQGPTTPDEPSI